MSQEPANLNWYHKPPDYFSVRDSSSRDPAAGQSRQTQTAQQVRAGPDHDTDEGTFTFDDFIDIINPLQHLPLISTVYRAVTDDEISAHARIIGGGLFGGGSGFIAAIADSIAEEATGQDLAGNLFAAVFGGDGSDPDTLAEAPAASERKGQERARVAPHPDAQQDHPLASAQAGAVAKNSAPDPETTPEIPGPPDDPAALEGEAALAALFGDLRGGTKTEHRDRPPAATVRAEAKRTQDHAAAPEPGAAPSPPPAPGRITLDPTLFVAQKQAAGTAAGEHQPEHVFSTQMLEGLQKYEEMMTQRQVSQSGPAVAETRDH